MSSLNPKWTPEQSAGITTTGTNLLLSAAAGSGKTAVLTGAARYTWGPPRAPQVRSTSCWSPHSTRRPR